MQLTATHASTSSICKSSLSSVLDHDTGTSCIHWRLSSCCWHLCSIVNRYYTHRCCRLACCLSLWGQIIVTRIETSKWSHACLCGDALCTAATATARSLSLVPLQRRRYCSMLAVPLFAAYNQCHCHYCWVMHTACRTPFIVLWPHTTRKCPAGDALACMC